MKKLVRQLLAQVGHVPKKLPCKECKGQCCTYPPFKEAEYKLVRDKYGIPEGTLTSRMGKFARVLYLPGGVCPFLKDGECSVYEDRPIVCKEYGEVKHMPCQYLFPKQAEKTARVTIRKAIEGTLDK